jgi:DNA-binding NtrC family response regulator
MARILILDEYQPLRELLAEELVGEGYFVISIGKHESVLNGIITSNPDLAILDLFVRGKYRWELLDMIRALKPDLPIIIYSTHYPAGDPHLQQIEAFVQKSCLFDELKQWIRGILTEYNLAVAI